GVSRVPRPLHGRNGFLHPGTLALHRRARQLVAAVARRSAEGRRGTHRMEKRRIPARRLAGAVRSALGALIALGGAATATACELPPGVRLESERLALTYWTIPAKIAVGQAFVLELAACPKTSAPVSERVKFDAY